MNILEKLNKNKDIYRFGFCGSDDFSTGFGLSELFDNIDDIENYFKSKDGTIINKDDFIESLTCFQKQKTEFWINTRKNLILV